MNQSSHLIFQSQAFPRVEGEDEETNPGIFGKALVDWLAGQLPRHGYEVTRTLPEDFGRLIQLKTKSCGLDIAVSSTDETASEWRVFVSVRAGMLTLLTGKASQRSTERDELLKVLSDIVRAHPGVSDVRTEVP